MTEQLNLILKRITLTTYIIVAAFLISISVLIFYKPQPSANAVQMKNDALEDLRQAEIKLVNAKLDSIRLDQKQADLLKEKKDLELNQRLDENTKALNRTRAEKPRDFSNYNSIDLQREVSDLVRLYVNSK